MAYTLDNFLQCLLEAQKDKAIAEQILNAVTKNEVKAAFKNQGQELTDDATLGKILDLLNGLRFNTQIGAANIKVRY